MQHALSVYWNVMMGTDEFTAQARLGEELLAQGDYAQGFQLYDAWRQLFPDQWLDLPIPRWSGRAAPNDRLLITGEQGFGDQIMFARFAQMIRASGTDVIWLCEPPLERLLNRCLDIPAVSRESGGEVGDVTWFCPSSALPNGFFPPLIQPPGNPYMRSPAPRLIPGKKIGVVTQGSSKHDNDHARSLPADLGADLIEALPGAVDLSPESTGARDFYDTAALMAGLDLVISVDSAPVHLAGAMGKPVWVLLPFEADWRWRRHTQQSAWYKTARLFRQAEPGGWRRVIDEVLACVADRSAL